MTDFKVITRDDSEYERVVFAEVLIPGVPNTWNDFWTEAAIKEAAYMFMRDGFGIDVEHDNNDVTGDAYVVESFIVREGDPDFIKGSWVVGMKIESDELWEAVLGNELNGYSYEALVEFLPGVLVYEEDDGSRSGVTEPDVDGHTHTFVLLVDQSGAVISGGTDTVQGHWHNITTHTITGKAAGHSHRFNLVQGKDGK